MHVLNIFFGTIISQALAAALADKQTEVNEVFDISNLFTCEDRHASACQPAHCPHRLQHDGKQFLNFAVAGLCTRIIVHGTQVRRNRIAVVEARERRVQDQIDVAMVHNEELEKEYDKLNTHAKQLTGTVQTVCTLVLCLLLRINEDGDGGLDGMRNGE